MKKEFALSVCIMIVLAFVTNGAIEASSYPTQVVLTGMAVALFFYYIHHHTRGFSIDIALAQKSLVIGAIAAIPVTTHLAS